MSNIQSIFHAAQETEIKLPEEPCSSCPQGQSGCFNCPERQEYEKALKEVKNSE